MAVLSANLFLSFLRDKRIGERKSSERPGISDFARFDLRAGAPCFARPARWSTMFLPDLRAGAPCFCPTCALEHHVFARPARWSTMFLPDLRAGAPCFPVDNSSVARWSTMFGGVVPSR
jgi:hypothetical protein